MDAATKPPTPEELATRLGKAAPLWAAVLKRVRERAPELTEAWHFAGAKVGWSLRLVEGERVLVYVIPEDGGFRVGLVLGKKGVAAAREAGLSEAATALLDAAPIYAEGHGVRFPVTSRADLGPFVELLAIKTSAPPKREHRRKRR